MKNVKKRGRPKQTIINALYTCLYQIINSKEKKWMGRKKTLEIIENIIQFYEGYKDFDKNLFMVTAKLHLEEFDNRFYYIQTYGKINLLNTKNILDVSARLEKLSKEFIQENFKNEHR